MLQYIACVHKPDKVFGPFLVQEKTTQRFGQTLVLNCGQDAGNLRIGLKGNVNTGGGNGPFAQYRYEPLSAPSQQPPVFRLRSVANENLFLFAGSRLRSGSEKDKEIQLIFVPCAPLDQQQQPGTIPAFTARVTPKSLAAVPSRELSAEEKLHFVEWGFLHLKKVVSPDLVEAAVREINAMVLREGGIKHDPVEGTKFCPGLGGCDAIQSLLFESPAWSVVEQLLGKDQAIPPPGAQVALRPPEPVDKVPEPLPIQLPPRQWHIDGMGKGKHSPFSVLVGITLSDASKPFSGNFCVFPGSHRTLLPSVKQCVMSGSSIFSKEASTAVEKPELTNGHQVLAEAGDVVFAHQKLAHRGGPNYSTNIRYQIYYRISSRNHQDMVANGAVLEDLWVEFAPEIKEKEAFVARN